MERKERKKEGRRGKGEREGSERQIKDILKKVNAKTKGRY